MKRILLWFLGLAALAIFIAALNWLFQAQTLNPLPNETLDALGISSGTPTAETSAADWENAALDQIQFGEPRVAFTHGAGIKLYSWLPDNRRLLVELEDPKEKDPAKRYIVATVNVETGELLEYGHRRDFSDRPPVWVENVQGIAYPTWNTWQQEPPRILLGLSGNRVQVVDEHANAYLAPDPRTGNFLYLEMETPDQPVHLFSATENRELFIQPAIAQLPYRFLRTDAKGRWIASLNGFDESGSANKVVYVDRESGQVSQVELDAKWVLDGAWSPNARHLALTLGNGSQWLSESRLVILNPQSQKVRNLNLPTLLFPELDWGPSSRHLLVRQVPLGSEPSQPHRLLLIDIKDGKMKRVPLFEGTIHPEPIYIAWSANGLVAWLKGNNIMITQASPARKIQ